MAVSLAITACMNRVWVISVPSTDDIAQVCLKMAVLFKERTGISYLVFISPYVLWLQ